MWLRQKIRSFTEDDRGLVAGTLWGLFMWTPLIMALLLLAVDATMAFMRQSHLWQVSREAARIVSRFEMTEAQAETYVRQQAEINGVQPTVDVRFEFANVIVESSLGIQTAAPFGALRWVAGETINARVTHAMEPL